MGRGRAEIGEKTPGDPEHGGGKVLPCGWSHRWIVGRGKEGAAAAAASAAARARKLVKAAFSAPPPTTPVGTAKAPPAGTAKAAPRVERAEYRRPMTAEQIDRLLEREARERPPPEPDG